MIRKDSRLRRFGVLVIGVVCFAIAAAYLAAHPDHTWQEVTGEPEHYLTEIEIEPVRWWSIVSYFLAVVQITQYSRMPTVGSSARTARRMSSLSTTIRRYSTRQRTGKKINNNSRTH